jgi:hypothetical protein
VLAYTNWNYWPQLGRTEELFDGVWEFLDENLADELVAGFEGWIDRVRSVIAHDEQYHMKAKSYEKFRFLIAPPWLCRKTI